MILSIVSPSDGAVKPARSVRKGRGVHIPAMKNADFGQVLRTLELTRAFN